MRLELSRPTREKRVLSFLTYLHIVSGVVCVVCPFAGDEKRTHSWRSSIISMRSYAPQYPRSFIDFWSRLAKSLHSQKVSVTWTGKMDQKLASVLVSEKLSWATATATQSIQKCKTQIEQIGRSRVDTELTVWGLDAQVWNLL